MTELYKRKYYKYKTKYLSLKGSGDNKPKITLYHGSPYDVEVLETRSPRGHNEFQRMNAVFFTDDIDQAKIYALARDKERTRRGWAVFKGKLYTLDDFQFNDIGYVYQYTTDDYLTDPSSPQQFAIPHNVTPDKKITVYPEDIKHSHIVLTMEEMKKLSEEMKKYIDNLTK